MNKFKKKTRSKMIAASIAILSSAAVVSTGFAAWVISGGDSKEGSGTITADAVEESYHTITFSTKSASITFGGPAEETGVTSPWLTNNSPGKESLLATFEFTVANVKTGEDDAPGKLFSSITLSEDGNDKKYSTAATEGFVSALPTWTKTTYDTDVPTYNSQTGVGDSGIYLKKGSDKPTAEGALSFTLSIQLTWGNKFNNKNPFFFYNVTGKTAATHGEEAKTNLEAVKAITGAAFTLTITTK